MRRIIALHGDIKSVHESQQRFVFVGRFQEAFSYCRGHYVRVKYEKLVKRRVEHLRHLYQRVQARSVFSFFDIAHVRENNSDFFRKFLLRHTFSLPKFRDVLSYRFFYFRFCFAAHIFTRKLRSQNCPRRKSSNRSFFLPFRPILPADCIFPQSQKLFRLLRFRRAL